MNLHDAETELVQVRAQIQLLLERVRVLEAAIRRMKSSDAIARLGITRSQVHTPYDADQWFSVVSNFAGWLRTHKKLLPYASWNDKIYYTTDLLNGDLQNWRTWTIWSDTDGRTAWVPNTDSYCTP